MKNTTKAFLAGIAATALPVLCFGLWHSVHTAEWLICNIKNPGKSALLEIQADMDARRYDIAKQKIDAFAKSWEEFSSGPDSWTGRGIIDVPIHFLEISATGPTNVESPSGPANGSQPIRSETNSTSSAVGSRR